jgi:ribosomal protein L22
MPDFENDYLKHGFPKNWIRDVSIVLKKAKKTAEVDTQAKAQKLVVDNI